MRNSWVWEIPENARGTRADKGISEALENEDGEWEGEARPVSRSHLQKLMEAGAVTSNGAPIGRSDRLAPGSIVRIELPEPEPLELVPEDIPLDILYEDSHLIVVNKPPGLTVHPSSTQRTGTLVHGLLHHVRDLSGIGGKLRPGIVHRIDKDTSGALVITKTDAAHVALSAVFAKHDIERAYTALCYGAPAWPGERIRCETLIGRNPNDRLKMSAQVKEGRKAITHLNCESRFAHEGKTPFASKITATLETGRTHQVRVHLTSLNHSLLGDPLYGSPSSNQPKWRSLPTEIQELVKKLPGQALHARILGFKHPVTGDPLRFEAPYPPDFQRLLDSLERYA
jgi:23S rRNA pseudouridine1911/1915/1917 synthase